MATGADIVNLGQTWVAEKVPYVWGGVTKAGADCSGFVQNVLGQLGIKVGRTVADQAKAGKAVALGPSNDLLANAVPGDILIYGSSHEAIYAGGGMMIDEPHTGAVASYRKVWFSSGGVSLTGIRRVTDEAGTLENVSIKDDIGDAVTGQINQAIGGWFKSNLIDPIAKLSGGSFQQSMIRMSLIIFGAVLLLIAFHALSSTAETPLGASVEGSKSAGRAVKKHAKQAATAAVVVPK